MDTIISAISLILKILMDIPSTTVATADSKKRQVAKALAKLASKLDEIINRGYKIISISETILTIKESMPLRETCSELEELLNAQIASLRDVDSNIQSSFLENENFKRLLGRKSARFQKNYSELHNILSVFAPEVIELWGPTSAGKQWLANTWLNVIKLDSISANPNEIDFDVRNSILDKLSTSLGVKFSSPSNRNKYFREAKIHLKEVEKSRKKLAILVQKHYEPHHLI